MDALLLWGETDLYEWIGEVWYEVHVNKFVAALGSLHRLPLGLRLQ